VAGDPLEAYELPGRRGSRKGPSRRILIGETPGPWRRGQGAIGS